MKLLGDLRIKLFADGADRSGMLEMYRNPMIKGFTTNPTLMRQAGVTDYEAFAHDILSLIPDRPISFEVFSDDFEEMYRQARKIAAWGEHVYVKIPVTNTKGSSAASLIRGLTQEGIKVNVTAVLTLPQVTGTFIHVPEYDTLSCQLSDGRLVKATSNVLKSCSRASSLTCIVVADAAPPRADAYS